MRNQGLGVVVIITAYGNDNIKWLSFCEPFTQNLAKMTVEENNDFILRTLPPCAEYEIVLLVDELQC